eukprot:Clim_evm14s167 gene=Clim_evmTU14s167
MYQTRTFGAVGLGFGIESTDHLHGVTCKQQQQQFADKALNTTEYQGMGTFMRFENHVCTSSRHPLQPEDKRRRKDLDHGEGSKRILQWQTCIWNSDNNFLVTEIPLPFS